MPNVKSLICLLAALVSFAPFGQTEEPVIQHIVIEPATVDTPRSDTASIAELSGGRLMVVYHKYHRGKDAGHDRGVCTIWSKISVDGGRNWK